MSNEIQCNLFGYGPPEPLSNFIREFKRDELLADVPIPAGGPDDRERRQVAHGTRFIYPIPGIKWQVCNEAPVTEEMQNIMEDVEREGYDGWVTPPKVGAGANTQFSLTFTCPCDPPSTWIRTVIEKHFDSDLRLMFRWQDLDNYWRCVECGAFDGSCTRVGAFWSVSASRNSKHKHVASWWGRNPCKCEKKADRRAIWDGSDDNNDYGPTREICSITAIDEGNSVIRVISTDLTGVRSMTRQKVIGSDPAQAVLEINRSRMSGPTVQEE